MGSTTARRCRSAKCCCPGKLRECGATVVLSTSAYVGNALAVHKHRIVVTQLIAGHPPARGASHDVAKPEVRRDGGQWGNSLCKVLRARGQFALSTTSKNYVFDDADAWQQAWLVAGFALDLWKLPADWRPSIVPNADHFYAADGVAMPPGWAKGSPLAVIGDHRFYHAD